MNYTAKNISVSVHHYPVDGEQITVWKWVNDDWQEVVDSRFISDSFWESMCSALCQAGYEWEDASAQCFDWGIEEPDYEEED